MLDDFHCSARSRPPLLSLSHFSRSVGSFFPLFFISLRNYDDIYLLTLTIRQSRTEKNVTLANSNTQNTPAALAWQRSRANCRIVVASRLWQIWKKICKQMVNEQRRTSCALIADAGWQRVLTAWMCNRTGTCVCVCVCGGLLVPFFAFVLFHLILLVSDIRPVYSTAMQNGWLGTTAAWAVASIILHFSMQNVIYVSRAHTKSTFHKSVGIRKRMADGGVREVPMKKMPESIKQIVYIL